jgi:very-short-patch-repair endonuclease
MKPAHSPTPELLRLAAAQSGMLTVGQAAELGLGRHGIARLVRSGRWRRCGPSLVFVHDLDPPWPAHAWGGVLLAGPGARVGGLAAAHLHGLCDEPPDQILIMVPRHRQLADRPPWLFRQERAGTRSARSPGDPPRLTVEDTVLDLSTDPGAAIHWVTAAVQSGRTTPHRLREALAARDRIAHRRMLSNLLEEVRAGAQSPLEVRYLRDVERAHGLPRSRRQLHRGRAGARHDLGYREFGLIVELDGRLGHVGEGRFRDLRRDNAALVDGYSTLRYGWGDVTEDPCLVARQVAEVLARHGWPGLPARCDRCRSMPCDDSGWNLAG